MLTFTFAVEFSNDKKVIGQTIEGYKKDFESYKEAYDHMMEGFETAELYEGENCWLSYWEPTTNYITYKFRRYNLKIERGES